MQHPFAGRQHELASLKDLRHKKTASLVVIKGRRRIGKSRLAEEFAKPYRFLRFSGIPPHGNTTAQEQRDVFSQQLRSNGLPMIKAEDWADLFSFIAREAQKGQVVVLFDEISWMGSCDPNFLGKLKNAWDIEFKKNPQLVLILCGSVSTWIEDNILHSTGFMGRLSMVLHLEELSAAECNQFLTALRFRGNAHEKLKILSVTGGIPRYLEEIKSDRLADENIKDLCFKKEGVLFREFHDVFLDIFARKSDNYIKVINALVDGPKELSDIAEAMGLQVGGHVSEYLNDLIKSGFIKRDFTWNVKGNRSRLSHYRLSDNYMRFYLKYIEKNKGKIEAGHFDQQPLSALPGFDSMMGLQFENLVLNNRPFIWQKLHLYPHDIITDNPYFQRAQIRKKGCQIDYLVQTKTQVLYACEIKFSKQEIKATVIDEMKQKLANLYLPRGFSVMPVLIHANGVSEAVVDHAYFSHIIDFSEVLA